MRRRTAPRNDGWAFRALFLLLSLLLPFTASAQTVADPSAFFTISADDAEQALCNALIAQGAGDRVTATISSASPLKPLYSSQLPLSVEVKTLKFDASNHTYSANLLFKSGDSVLSAMPVSGRFDETLSVPILSRPFRNGEVIADADVTTRDFPSSRVRPGTVTDAAQLIGKTPRHSITGNRPVREEEIQAPAMVKKGAVVQMVYHTPFMQVQTMGEALEDGSEGARIRVKNTDSHAIVYGVVISENEVSVGNPGTGTAQILSNAPPPAPSIAPRQAKPTPIPPPLPVNNLSPNDLPASLPLTPYKK